MSATAIEMKSYAETGLVSVSTVNALLRFGEPMITETVSEPCNCSAPDRDYRAWIRLRSGGRTFGVWDMSPQLAAESLLEKLGGRR